MVGVARPSAWPVVARGSASREGVRWLGGVGSHAGVTGWEPADKRSLQNLLGLKVRVGERQQP